MTAGQTYIPFQFKFIVNNIVHREKQLRPLYWRGIVVADGLNPLAAIKLRTPWIEEKLKMSSTVQKSAIFLERYVECQFELIIHTISKEINNAKNTDKYFDSKPPSKRPFVFSGSYAYLLKVVSNKNRKKQ